jgi:RHS repeat-associated protein
VVRLDDDLHGAPELFEYDADGRVRTISHPTGGRTSYAFDPRGREVRRRVFGGAYDSLLYEVVRTRDGAGRLRAVRLDGELLVEHEWADGLRIASRFGNGLTRHFERDDATGLVIATSTQRADGSPVEATTIDRAGCGLGKLCYAISSAVWLDDPATRQGVWNLGEEHYQLEWHPSVAADEPTPGPWLRLSSSTPILAIAEGDRLRFDALGNLAAHQPRGGQAEPFVYNAERNRLRAGGFTSEHVYAYDEAGYVTERDGVDLGWTAAGRLASIGGDVRIAWDAMGRPVERTLGGETTRYGFGGGVEVDAAGWPVATEIEGVRVVLGTGLRRYAHADFRGNVAFVTDEVGHVLRRHVYGPFGERHVVDHPGGAREPGEGERGFARGVHMAGLVLLGARLYDPDAGRFLAPDPIDHLLTDFAYTRGNPIWLWDPGGLHATPSQGQSITPGGQATMMVGGGFMGLGAAMAGNGVMAGPAAPAIVGAGVTIFIIGVTMVFAGASMTYVVSGDDGDIQPGEMDVGGLAMQDAVGAHPVCAPDRLVPPPPRLTGLALLVVLMAVLGVERACRRSPRP